MRKTWRILLLALLAIGATLILSCAPPPVTISDTLSGFVSSLNANRSNTYTYTDPNAGNYNAAKTPSFWNAAFPPASGPFALVSGYDTSNPSSVMATITANTIPTTYKFVMVNNKNNGSDDWLINEIFNGGSQIF